VASLASLAQCETQKKSWDSFLTSQPCATLCRLINRADVAALIDQLTDIPDSWALVAVGNDKRPYQPEWQKHPLTKRQVETELHAGRAVAVGVLAGPPSGGLLFVDHDGLGASEVLANLGTSLRDLPKSWAVTSGRDGRLQIIYSVPRGF